MRIPVLSLEGKGYLPPITRFCEVFRTLNSLPQLACFTVKGEPGHLSSQLTLSSFETFSWEFGLSDLSSSRYDTCKAMKRGKYMNGKVELDCACFVGSGKAL